MKQLFLITLSIFCLNINYGYSQNASISQTGTAAHPSAAFEVSSNTGGILIPRMSTIERNAIANPAEGLQIFNTDTKCFEYYAYGFWQTGNCATCFMPDDASTITGSSSVCQGVNGVNYSVPSINNANTYVWSYSGTGVTINGSSETITIDFSTTATSGNLTVKGNNQCGDGIISSAFPVTVNSVPPTPTVGTHAPSQTEIIWNWNTVQEATGYKYNTVNDYGTANDNGTDTSFTQNSLSCNTSYTLYVWAYNNCGNSVVNTLIQNTSACGWLCGSSFTDTRDNNVYNTVQIGNQCWMAQNLAFLDVVTGIGVYSKTVPYKHVYGYNGTDVSDAKATTNYATYGVIYNWPAMLNGSSPCNGSGPPPNDKCTNPIQGVCPTGWHVPSHYEMTTMERNVGTSPGAFPYDNNTSNVFLGTDEGGNLKETGTSLWASPNTGATNSSGFAAKPGGKIWMGNLYYIGTASCWLSSSERDASAAWYRELDNTHATIYRAGYSDSKWLSAYVRCVKD